MNNRSKINKILSSNWTAWTLLALSAIAIDVTGNILIPVLLLLILRKTRIPSLMILISFIVFGDIPVVMWALIGAWTSCSDICA